MDYANNDNIEGYELVNGYDFPLYIDNKAIMYVIGTEMDYIKEKFGERFTFNNPNQTRSAVVVKISRLGSFFKWLCY